MDLSGGPLPIINPAMMGVLPMLPGFGAPQMQQGPGPMPPGRAPGRGRMQPRGGRQGRGGRGPQAMMQQAPSQPWPAAAPANLGLAPLPMLEGYAALSSGISGCPEHQQGQISSHEQPHWVHSLDMGLSHSGAWANAVAEPSCANQSRTSMWGGNTRTGQGGP